MFFKQICIVVLGLCIWGYFYGDYIFYKQAEYMIYQGYNMPAYESYERIVRYYPTGKYAKLARQKMQELRDKCGVVAVELAKREKEYEKEQKTREKNESFR